MKQQINAFDYAGHICSVMKKGILLTTKAGEKVNTMTIGWGTIGIEWGKPIFVAYVRVGRHTRQMLDETGEFTINVPYGDVDSRILGVCGTKSGRDTDKIAELGLELVDSDVVSVPGIRHRGTKSSDVWQTDGWRLRVECASARRSVHLLYIRLRIYIQVRSR